MEHSRVYGMEFIGRVPGPCYAENRDLGVGIQYIYYSVFCGAL